MAYPSFAATPGVPPANHQLVSVQNFLHEVPPLKTADTALLRTQDTSPTPPTTADCIATIGVPCYSPLQLAHAYGADRAFRQGLTGEGATVAVVESYGDPAIQSDVKTFDRAYGLPDASVETVPYGVLPGSVSTPDQVGWAEETALDVEMVHTMAPEAHIIVLAVGADETTGSTGMDTMSAAMSWLVMHRSVDALSLSWGAPEANFAEEAGSVAAGNQLLYPLRGGLQAAADRHVSVLAGAGDWGPTGPTLSGTALYPYRTAFWPASDPLVTAVGGTQLNLDNSGNRITADTAWSADRLGLATGGGLSTAFSRPDYQDKVSGIVGAQRGLPDISAVASCASPVVVYSYYKTDGTHGWARLCGTSVAAPDTAGIVADAAALAHHPVGDIGATLYGLSQHEGSEGVADVVAGCNTDFGVAGFCASSGYDLATGWGTIGSASALIRELAFPGK